MFRPIGQFELLSDLELRIYNRWGFNVYSEKGANLGWDGYYKGVLQEIGAYIYILSFRYNNEFFDKKGSVTLIR